ncbi:hypothetical protein SETIT_3G214200v2 [Setaria italica]|uniref:Uncharacterized protein n=1 Tax=Setaria italica TaxID=4555 RepID=A0A368QHT5_SETIT|nr:hypothetical protein SETIT_3G214200v2 [Setaria italica]
MVFAPVCRLSGESRCAGGDGDSRVFAPGCSSDGEALLLAAANSYGPGQLVAVKVTVVSCEYSGGCAVVVLTTWQRRAARVAVVCSTTNRQLNQMIERTNNKLFSSPKNI